MNLRTSALSDIGRVRPENEDSFLCNDTQQIYAVADGIGGLPSGAQASEMAVEVLGQIFSKYQPGLPVDYQSVVEQINDKVFLLGRVLSPQFGIGSTLTFAHLTGTKLNIGHVGDSTALRVRAKQIEQLTTDHTIENELREREARGESLSLLMENRNALTRCIGQPPPILAHCCKHTVLPRDRYLLCSDGISRYIAMQEIEEIMLQSSEPGEAAQTLINRANERGGLDNSTAVVLFFD
jgi:serine/threonine protein phosphatase PrpC